MAENDVPQEGAKPEDQTGQEPEPTQEPTQEPTKQPDTPDDPFPEPEPLPEQDQFDRAYVEKLREQAANYRVKAKELAEPFGDPDTAKQAAKIYDALQSEEGVAQLFVESGQALGLGVKELEALFGEGDAPAATKSGDASTEEPESGEGSEDDQIAQLQKQIEELRQEQTQTVQQQRQATAKAAAQEALSEIGLDPSDKDQSEIVNQVLTLGQKHIGENEWAPDKIKSAVKKGHEDLQRVVESQAEQLLAKKKKDRDEQPGSIDGGASPGGEPEEEPQDLKTAKKRAREKFKKSGLLK